MKLKCISGTKCTLVDFLGMCTERLYTRTHSVVTLGVSLCRAGSSLYSLVGMHHSVCTVGLSVSGEIAQASQTTRRWHKTSVKVCSRIITS